MVLYRTGIAGLWRNWSGYLRLAAWFGVITLAMALVCDIVCLTIGPMSVDLLTLIEYHLVVVKCRSLNSELSLCTPVQCCLAAAVCLSSVLPTCVTRRAVPTDVGRGYIPKVFTFKNLYPLNPILWDLVGTGF